MSTTIYDLLYDYLHDYIFCSTALDTFSTQLGVSVSFNDYLCHATCIVLMILFVSLLISFAYWLFKLCSGLFLLKH